MQLSFNYRRRLRRAPLRASLPSLPDSPRVLSLRADSANSATGWSRNRGKNWMRKAHALAGIILSLNLLLLLVTGMLIQHRDALRLEERSISRTFLPDDYRPQDGPQGVRADIVVTDLHSGRIFGPTGILVLDAITLGSFLLLSSGVVLFLLGRWRKENGLTREESAEK